MLVNKNFLIIALLLLFNSCRKEEDSDGSFTVSELAPKYSTCEAIWSLSSPLGIFIDNEPWAASAFTTYRRADGELFLSATNANSSNFIFNKYNLSFYNLPEKIGKHKLEYRPLGGKQISVLFTETAQDAMGLATYGVDTSRIDNYIEIEEIDKAKGLMKGSFNCTLLNINDTLKFRKGKFKVKYQ